MNEEINKKVRTVKNQISNLFSGKIDEELKTCKNSLPKLKSKVNTKTKSMADLFLPKTTRNKELMLLPNISIHRNPMSYVTDREILRFKPLIRRKTVSKGSLYYKMAFKNSTERIDWDNVITTCSRLISERS